MMLSLHKKNSFHTKRTQNKSYSGQAMIETLVLVTGLFVPLFFGVYYLNKYLEVRDTTIEASRYAAWETTVANPNIGGVIAERFFKNKMAGFRGNDGDDRIGWGGERVVQRVFHDGQLLTNPEDDELVDYDDLVHNNQNLPASAVTSGPEHLSGLSVAFMGTRFLPTNLDAGFTRQGSIQTEVSVPLGRSVPLDSGGSYIASNRPTITMQSAIVSDVWLPTSEANLTDRVGEMAPFDTERPSITSLSGALESSELMVQRFSLSGRGPGIQELNLALGGSANTNEMVSPQQSIIIPGDRCVGSC